MDPSALSTENIIGTVLAGIGIAAIAIRQYLREKKVPTTQTGDRVVPGVSIADMTPFREIATALDRSASANERMALALDGLLKMMRDQSQDDEIEEKIERRIENLLARLDKPARGRTR